MRKVAHAIGIGVCAIACGHGSAPNAGNSLHAGRVGSSIALLADQRVAVVNPDQGSVSIVDASTLAPIATIDVGGEPHAILQIASGALLVANYRGGQVVAIDPASGSVTSRTSICAGAYGLAESPDRTWVAVACEWEGAIFRLDPSSMEAVQIAHGLRRPRAIVIDGSDVVAFDYVGGNVHRIDSSGSDHVTSLVPATAAYRPALTRMTANLTSAALPAFGAIHVAHALENNSGDTTLEPVADDYGTVADTNPKINPAVTSLGAATPVLYAKFDGGNRVFNGPAALAAFGDRDLLVANLSTGNVAVIDASATDAAVRAIGSFRVGSGPSGIAVDDVNHVAYVDNAFDQSISRIDLTRAFDSTAPIYEPDLTLVRSLPSPYSAAALAGRKLFFDASNTHVTPSGVVACSSCHPGGSDDGLVWFEHTSSIPTKRRRTPHLANARSTTAPFHWNGEFRTMPDLVFATMTDLMAGDGLLVDASTIQAYIDEIVKEPILPPLDASSAARGEALFTSPEVGCSTCHAGADTTDDMMHAVLDPMTLTSDDAFTVANTPGLRGLFLTAPYFHDGRAADLHDVLTRADAAGMGHANMLSEPQLQDLIAYLQTL